MYGRQRVHGDRLLSCHIVYPALQILCALKFRASIGTFLAITVFDFSTGFSQAGEVAKRLDSGQEEISAAPYRRKPRYPTYLFLDGSLRNCQIVSTILSTEDRITLISQLVESRIVGPDIHGKLELSDEAGTAHERRDSPFYAVLGSTLWQRRTVSPATPNHLPPIHVCRGVSRIHPSNV